MDKGYYDYDYEKPKKKRGRNISKATDPDKLAKKLARLGVGTATRQHFTPDEIQKIAMEEVKAKKQRDA